MVVVQLLSCVDYLWTHGLQHARLPCPSLSPESAMPSNYLILCCPLLLLPSIFPSIRVFSSESFFVSGGQSTGASTSASVLPMNIQDWCPFGLTYLISLQSKGLSRVFSNTTIQKHQFFFQLRFHDHKTLEREKYTSMLFQAQLKEYNLE